MPVIENVLHGVWAFVFEARDAAVHMHLDPSSSNPQHNSAACQDLPTPVAGRQVQLWRQRIPLSTTTHQADVPVAVDVGVDGRGREEDHLRRDEGVAVIKDDTQPEGLPPIQLRITRALRALHFYGGTGGGATAGSGEGCTALTYWWDGAMH